MGELAPANRAAIRNWSATGGSLLLGAPLLLLVGLAIIALFVGTKPSAVLSQLRDPEALQSIALSLRTTAVSVAAVIVFGTGVAVAIHRSRRWLAGALEIVVTLPAIMPPSVAGIALLLAFGRQGLLGSELSALGLRIPFTSLAVIMSQAFVATPFFVRELATGLNAIDPDVLDAARIDGAGAYRLGASVMLPIALPFLIGGAVLAWARSVGEFGATILFAGNLPGVTQTVPLAIYLGFETNLEQAKALAVLLMLCAIIVLVILRILFRRQMTFAH